MIKRRFYRFEHGDKDAPSESYSSDSDSDSDVEPQSTDEAELEDEEESDEEEVANTRIKEEASLPSGYESESSSANEVNLDSSGLPTSDDDAAAQNGRLNNFGSSFGGAVPTIALEHSSEKDTRSIDVTDCVVKCKSVFKCRLCPRIVCLSEDTLKAHLNSKRHARSVKLLKEGRLKLSLDSDGKIDGETDPENHPITNVPEEESTKSTKKGKGRPKQRKRGRQEKKPGKAKPAKENRAARRK